MRPCCSLREADPFPLCCVFVSLSKSKTTQAALPSACDLELAPAHLCGLGLSGLSAAQLEALEALHRAALARVGVWCNVAACIEPKSGREGAG